MLQLSPILVFFWWSKIIALLISHWLAKKRPQSNCPVEQTNQYHPVEPEIQKITSLSNLPLYIYICIYAWNITLRRPEFNKEATELGIAWLNASSTLMVTSHCNKHCILQLVANMLTVLLTAEQVENDIYTMIRSKSCYATCYLLSGNLNLSKIVYFM